MPTTSPWNIPYPDGPTNLTALQSHFANIANAINGALTTGLGGAPRLATSDSMRATLIPAPIQGDTVVRPDLGYTEQYYALYNASTNPSGATPAGWYPVSGRMPVYARGLGTNQSFVNGAYVILTGYGPARAGLPDVEITRSGGTITIQQAGVYEVFANVSAIGAGNIEITIRAHINGIAQNDLTDTDAGTSYHYPHARGTWMVPLAVGDTFDMRCLHTWAGALNIQIINFAMRYVGPS